MTFDGHGALIERPREIRIIRSLSVIVRRHHPQPAKHLRRNLDAELADVALEKRSNKVVLPIASLRIRRRQKRSRKSSPPPEPAQRPISRLIQAEAPHLDQRDSAGQR